MKLLKLGAREGSSGRLIGVEQWPGDQQGVKGEGAISPSQPYYQLISGIDTQIQDRYDRAFASTCQIIHYTRPILQVIKTSHEIFILSFRIIL